MWRCLSVWDAAGKVPGVSDTCQYCMMTTATLKPIWESLVTSTPVTFKFSRFTSLALWLLSFKYYDVDITSETMHARYRSQVSLHRFWYVIFSTSDPAQCTPSSEPSPYANGPRLAEHLKKSGRVYEVRYARWLFWKLWRTLHALCYPLSHVSYWEFTFCRRKTDANGTSLMSMRMVQIDSCLASNLATGVYSREQLTLCRGQRPSDYLCIFQQFAQSCILLACTD